MTPPCHLLSPVLDEIAAKLSDKLIVAKLNVEENQVIAQRYGILAMPTPSVFRDGEVISQVVGARPKRRLLADLNGLPQIFLSADQSGPLSAPNPVCDNSGCRPDDDAGDRKP
jgi:thioredoxin 1